MNASIKTVIADFKSEKNVYLIDLDDRVYLLNIKVGSIKQIEKEKAEKSLFNC